jgi:hypothetical protein
MFTSTQVAKQQRRLSAQGSETLWFYLAKVPDWKISQFAMPHGLSL